jgi:hypothetical protein
MEYRKHALILAVVEKLRKYGSWTGKTHVQKALFLLSVASTIRVPSTFVLYKHGPYSFELEDELEQMKSYAAIVSETVQSGYGPTLRPGANATLVERQAPLSALEDEAIDRVCRFVGKRSVTELERLASAAWIRIHEGKQDPQEVAVRLHELKPHVSIPEAERADQEIIGLLAGNCS